MLTIQIYIVLEGMYQLLVLWYHTLFSIYIYNYIYVQSYTIFKICTSEISHMRLFKLLLMVFFFGSCRTWAPRNTINVFRFTVQQSIFLTELQFYCLLFCGLPFLTNLRGITARLELKSPFQTFENQCFNDWARVINLPPCK